MKIIHLVTSLNVGGAERFVIDVVKKQKQLGDDVSIVGFDCMQDVLMIECRKHNINVISLEGNFLERNKKFLSILPDVEVIHIHSPHVVKALFPILWRCKDKRVVYTRHGAKDFSDPVWIFAHAALRRSLDCVTFVSEDAFNVFQERYKWSDVVYHVIENGVDIGGITLNKRPSDKIRIGSVGRMVELKNQISLLRAVRMLPDHIQYGLEINFFGDGPCMDVLKAYVSESLPKGLVKFHGSMTDRSSIYSQIDFLVVASETEGLSMVIIEAMSCNIPVIATNVGGNPKPVIHGETGFLFDYDDDAELVDNLRKYINSPDLIKAHGDNASKHIKKRFSLDSTVKKYSDIYSG